MGRIEPQPPLTRNGCIGGSRFSELAGSQAKYFAGFAASRASRCAQRNPWEWLSFGEHSRYGHNHAAPRTPLLSPCFARTRRVRAGSPPKGSNMGGTRR
jgi:hypothetical protein